MKKLNLIIACLFVGFSSFAQSNSEDVDLIQSLFGKEKKEIVAGFISLDESNNANFWKLYDEYETARKEIGKKRIAIIERYVNEYMNLDDATTAELLKETQSLTAQNDKLITSYSNKIKKSVGVRQAAQFYQLESYLLSMIRATIFEGIPFIGELN